MNNVRDKVKQRNKISYKLFKEQYVYDTLLDIPPFPTLIQFTDFIGGIKTFVIFVG